MFLLKIYLMAFCFHLFSLILFEGRFDMQPSNFYTIFLWHWLHAFYVAHDPCQWNSTMNVREGTHHAFLCHSLSLIPLSKILPIIWLFSRSVEMSISCKCQRYTQSHRVSTPHGNMEQWDGIFSCFIDKMSKYKLSLNWNHSILVFIEEFEMFQFFHYKNSFNIVNEHVFCKEDDIYEKKSRQLNIQIGYGRFGFRLVIKQIQQHWNKSHHTHTQFRLPTDIEPFGKFGSNKHRKE